jgi:hypothetical protein
LIIIKLEIPTHKNQKYLGNHIGSHLIKQNIKEIKEIKETKDLEIRVKKNIDPMNMKMIYKMISMIIKEEDREDQKPNQQIKDQIHIKEIQKI